MPELDDFERQQRDMIVARFIEQGLDREKAETAATALVLQAASAGMLASLEGEDDE